MIARLGRPDARALSIPAAPAHPPKERVMTNPVTVELPVMYIAGTETGPSSLNRIPIGGGDVDGRQYMALFKSYDELDRFCNEKGNTSPNLTIVRLNTQEDLRRTL